MKEGGREEGNLKKGRKGEGEEDGRRDREEGIERGRRVHVCAVL